MAIFAISDLHLPFGINKPMNVFGKAWEDYTDKLYENWKKNVTEHDTVILPGDFSWATYLEQSIADFQFLEKLPGKKIIAKGNHDYFFTTMSKMEIFLKKEDISSVQILHNNFFLVEDTLICGSRGWDITAHGEEDEKLTHREAVRLELSIQTAKKAYPDLPVLAFLHYPPIYQQNPERDNPIRQVLKQYDIKQCYYGHLHAKGIENAYIGEYDGIVYQLISADYLEFMPLKIKP
ncbi:MAG: metallophosphoesterase [Clostridia bacterium]|nr:metallophosphoesterase [Clostridia bacterium]